MIRQVENKPLGWSDLFRSKTWGKRQKSITASRLTSWFNSELLALVCADTVFLCHEALLATLQLCSPSPPNKVVANLAELSASSQPLWASSCLWLLPCWHINFDAVALPDPQFHIFHRQLNKRLTQETSGSRNRQASRRMNSWMLSANWWWTYASLLINDLRVYHT